MDYTFIWQILKNRSRIWTAAKWNKNGNYLHEIDRNFKNRSIANLCRTSPLLTCSMYLYLLVYWNYIHCWKAEVVKNEENFSHSNDFWSSFGLQMVINRVGASSSVSAPQKYLKWSFCDQHFLLNLTGNRTVKFVVVFILHQFLC